MRIAALKEAVPIDTLIEGLGGRVNHNGSWTDWVPTFCPFHDDNIASASTNLAQGYFKCLACDAPRPEAGRAGDIIDVAMFHLGTTSVRDAMDWLEREFIHV